jgi:hypothetical protein
LEQLILDTKTLSNLVKMDNQHRDNRAWVSPVNLILLSPWAYTSQLTAIAKPIQHLKATKLRKIIIIFWLVKSIAMLLKKWFAESKMIGLEKFSITWCPKDEE